MLAVGGSIWPDACTDAELSRAHKVGPLVELLPRAKDVAVNETTDGVTVTVGAVVVELASVVAPGDVDLREVALAGDLDVLGGLYEVDACEGALGHHAGAMAGLRAVGDHLAFGVADGFDSGRSPQAEVIDAIEPCTMPMSQKLGKDSDKRTEGLAHGAGRRASATVVVTGLAILRMMREVVGEVTDVPH